MDSLSTKSTIGIAQDWMGTSDGTLLLSSLEYLDTVTLIQKKPVNKYWQEVCTQTIDNKCRGNKKKFATNYELRKAVHMYSPSYEKENTAVCHPKDAESIAASYGYPINVWDVSNVQDFSCIFCRKSRFNEPIRITNEYVTK